MPAASRPRSAPATAGERQLSRREFLKLCAAGLAAAGSASARLAGLPLAPYAALAQETVQQQGRVSEGFVTIHAQPSFEANELKKFWKDTVLPVEEVTIGGAEPAHNRVWYLIKGEGYVHSGGVQPVQTRLNLPESPPAGGALAEVTVPFTDARWGPGENFPVAYRFYYETTHWVVKGVQDRAGEAWYRVLDDKWKFLHYALARHLRLLPAAELSPLSPDVPAWAKRLVVDTAAQAVIAYEYEKPVFMTRTATGARFSNGDFSTPPGRYITAHKRPYRHMAAGNLAANGYDLPGVPWVTYITESGISFHGTYWHNNFGRPRSHGCINLTPSAARWIFRWTTPSVPFNEQFAIDGRAATPVDVL